MKAKCEPLEPSSVSLECCKDLININAKTYIMNASDVVIKNGEIRIKRKYGKFKRPMYDIKEIKDK